MSQSLEKIRQSIRRDHNLGDALLAMQPLVNQWAVPDISDEFEKISGDYQLMKDFMLRGYTDSEREKLYDSLLLRLIKITWKLQLHIARHRVPSFMKAYDKATAEFQGVDVLHRQLEEYVQEYALLTLGNEAANDNSDLHVVKPSQSVSSLNHNHQQALDVAFSAIISSSAWDDTEGSKWRDLFLSATVDTLDVAFLVSAVMLSAMMFSDSEKLSVLIEVYRSADSEVVRQRALVGIAFSMMQYVQGEDERLDSIIESFMSDEATVRQLIQLQEQVFLCMAADRDTKVIHDEIMPDIIGNKPYTINPDIFSKIDSPEELAEMFSVDEDDENIERIEKNMERMAQMQREGSDIYYGGFSHMKRLPFFYTLSNWFAPFSINHPALEQVRESKAEQMLNVISSLSPFCDSDKYSFALMLPNVISRFGGESMFGEGILEALPQEFSRYSSEEYSSAAYQRRFYLQSLYRFFRLSDFRHDFTNPFGYFLGFYDNRITSDAENMLPLVRLLYKRKLYDQLWEVLDSIPMSTSAEISVIRGRMLSRRGDYKQAADVYSFALKQSPENEMLLYGHVRAQMALGRYKWAMDDCRKLIDIRGDVVRYSFLLAVCQMETGQVDDALPTLFKLNYEHADDAEIAEVLAWALLLSGQAEKAEQRFDTLVSGNKGDGVSNNPSARQSVNASIGLAYSCWAQGKIEECVTLLANIAAQLDDKDFLSRFQSDANILEKYSITATDMRIVADIVKGRL